MASPSTISPDLAGAGIVFRDLTLGYDGHPAVHHLQASIPFGSLTAIVGPNGGGKSTLLKAIAGLVTPLSGELRLAPFTRDGSRGLSSGRGAGVAYLPQQASIDRNFPITVSQLVTLGLWREIGSWRGLSCEARSRVQQAIDAVGLNGFENRLINQLSGGQLQRVLFARVLLSDSPIILLDEPFNAIDAKTSADLTELILSWHAQQRTVLAVLHDLNLVRERFPQALLLARELIAAGPTRDVLTADNLVRARRMAEAWDDTAAVCTRSAAA